MKFIYKLILLAISNAVAIWVAAKLVSGITLQATALEIVMAGTLLGIVNSVIRPIIKIISLPLIFLTLGAFVVIINVGMLMLVSSFFDFFSISGFWSGLLGTIIISIVNYIISLFIEE